MILGDGEANAEIAQGILYDGTEFAHQGVAGSKWGVRKWQNVDGSYTPAGLADKPGGRYNQHSGEGTPWGEGQEDYSGHSERVGYDYSNESKYNTKFSRAEQDAAIRSVKKGAKTALAAGILAGTVVGTKLGYDKLDEVSGGNAKGLLTKDLPEIVKNVDIAGLGEIIQGTVLTKIGAMASEKLGYAEQAAVYDDDFKPSDVTNTSNLWRGAPVEQGSTMWRMNQFDPGSAESQRRKLYVVFDDGDANFYAAFGNGLAKNTDPEKPTISWVGTASRKLYVADINTVIRDVINSYTKADSIQGVRDRRAFDDTGTYSKATKWICRYLLGGQEDVQKRWVGNHAQVIDFYARAGYDGMSDLTDSFGGMSGTPTILFGADVKKGEQAFGKFEVSDKKVTQGIFEGTVEMVKKITAQRTYSTKVQKASEILRRTNAPKTVLDVVEAKKAKPMGDLATGSYDLQDLQRNMSRKFPSYTDRCAVNLKARGDSLSPINPGINSYKFVTNTKPSSDSKTRIANAEKAQQGINSAMRKMLNSTYSGKTKINYDGEKELIRDCGTMSFYSLVGGTTVKQSTYLSLRQQAIDYIFEHPDTEYDIHELMGILYTWG